MSAHAHIVELPQPGKERHQSQHPEKVAPKFSPKLGLEGSGTVAGAVSWTTMGRHQVQGIMGRKETHVVVGKVSTISTHSTY